jgi:hypothetical protein
MTITLEELTARLEEDVPARNSVPTATQYERCVRDAIEDFSERAGRTKVASLNIVAGTAQYELPDDFLRLIALESMAGADGVILSASGIIPMSESFNETWNIVNGSITFYPTPAYTVSRDYQYKAGWVEGEGGYELSEREARIVLLHAAASAMTRIANALSGDAWRYSIGDESVDKTNQAASLRAQAQKLAEDYLIAVNSYVGAQVIR